MSDNFNDVSLFAAQIPAAVNAVANSGTPLIAYCKSGASYTIPTTSNYEKIPFDTNTVRVNGSLSGWDLSVPGRFKSRYAQRILAGFRVSVGVQNGSKTSHNVFVRAAFNDASNGTHSYEVKSITINEENQRGELYLSWFGVMDTDDFVDFEIYGNSTDTVIGYTLEMETHDRYMVYVSED